jgi:hypothetical protein
MLVVVCFAGEGDGQLPLPFGGDDASGGVLLLPLSLEGENASGALLLVAAFGGDDASGASGAG